MTGCRRRARCSVNFGLEAALWYAPKGMEPSEGPTYRRSNAFPIVREECRAVRTAVGLMEISGGKYEIVGSGAASWLNGCWPASSRAGRMSLAPMLNAQGRIKATFRLLPCTRPFLMIGSGVAETYHMRWFERHPPPVGTVIRSLSHALTGFGVADPGRASWCSDSKQRLQRGIQVFDVRETALEWCRRL
jgi:dimethylglycine dehydrogenase